MKSKVLFIAESSHASPRIPEIMKNLGRHGWDSVVITSTKYDIPGIDQIITNSKNTQSQVLKFIRLDKPGGFQGGIQIRFPFLKPNLVKRLSKYGRSFISFPDEYRGWSRDIDRLIKQFTDLSDFQVIVSSSSPISAHFAARKISKKHNIPWIADFRDLWSDNHNYSFTKTRKFIDSMVEKKLIGDANAIVTVNEDWAARLRIRYPQKIFSIENAATFSHRPTVTKNSRIFRIVSTGPIYPGKHNLKMLLDSIHAAGNKISKPIQLDLYGPLSAENIEMINDYQALGCRVSYFGQISREECWEQQCQADLLVLFSWMTNTSSAGHIPLRTYEYLASGNPVISLEPNQDKRPESILGLTIKITNSLELQMKIIEYAAIQINPELPIEVNYSLTYAERAERYAELLNLISGAKPQTVVKPI